MLSFATGVLHLGRDRLSNGGSSDSLGDSREQHPELCYLESSPSLSVDRAKLDYLVEFCSSSLASSTRRYTEAIERPFQEITCTHACAG